MYLTASATNPAQLDDLETMVSDSNFLPWSSSSISVKGRSHTNTSLIVLAKRCINDNFPEFAEWQ